MPTLYQVVHVFRVYPPATISHDPTPGTYQVPMDVALSCGCGKPPGQPCRINVQYWDNDRRRGNELDDPRQPPNRAMCPNGCSEQVREMPGVSEQAMETLLDAAMAELDVQPGPGRTVLPMWAVILLALVIAAASFFAFRAGCRVRDAEAAPRPTMRQVERMAERYYRLPRGILRRLARVESTHRDLAPHRDGPGCAVGRYQLQVPSCDPVAMTHLQGRAVNTWAAAAWLAWSRAWCADRPGRCPCWAARWNWHRRANLCRKLLGGET